MSQPSRDHRKSGPLIALTMGDPAGIGPEIIVRGWKELFSNTGYRFVVYGSSASLCRAVDHMELDLEVVTVPSTDRIWAMDPNQIPVVECGGDVSCVHPGEVSAIAGSASVQYIESAITATLSGKTDAIVTAPICKESIHLAGVDFPGHTELLASRCQVENFAMMLYIPDGQTVGGPVGLGVVHTTLHQSLRSAIDELNSNSILNRCRLAHQFAQAALHHRNIQRKPRIAVAALNPHAGENGLFGLEESEIIAPAVKQARAEGLLCQGPISCDTLMGRAVGGEFDMVVAMYHDQGHIALKLLGMHRAVNVTLGLPIIRTSVAHGTAFEIAGTGQADANSLLKAVQVACDMVSQKPVPA